MLEENTACPMALSRLPLIALEWFWLADCPSFVFLPSNMSHLVGAGLPQAPRCPKYPQGFFDLSTTDWVLHWALRRLQRQRISCDWSPWQWSCSSLAWYILQISAQIYCLSKLSIMICVLEPLSLSGHLREFRSSAAFLSDVSQHPQPWGATGKCNTTPPGLQLQCAAAPRLSNPRSMAGWHGWIGCSSSSTHDSLIPLARKIQKD